MIVQCALLKCYTILGYSTETVLLIFPFLQTNITVQMRPSGGYRVHRYRGAYSTDIISDTTAQHRRSVYQCLHGTASEYLSNCSYLHQLGRLVTVSDPLTATSSSFRQSNCQYGRRAFSVSGPVVWNSLPDYLRDYTLSIIRSGAISKPTFLQVTNQLATP